jgi:hypothetical protein
MTDWLPVPRDLEIVYASVPEGGPRFLYGVSVGWGGPNGRTPMVRGRNGEWREHVIPLTFVWRYDERMKLLELLSKAMGSER